MGWVWKRREGTLTLKGPWGVVLSGNSHFKKGRRTVHRRRKCLRVWGSLLVITRGTQGLWREKGSWALEQRQFFPFSGFVELWRAHSLVSSQGMFLVKLHPEPRGLLSDWRVLRKSEWTELAWAHAGTDCFCLTKNSGHWPQLMLAEIQFALLATHSTSYFSYLLISVYLGFPGDASGKEPTYQYTHKRCGFDPWVRKIPWRRAWQPTPVFLPGESRGQRSLVGYSS